MRWLRHPIASLSSRLGGGDRARIILILGCVFGLNGADKGSVGAMATVLEDAFRINRTELGLLLTASLGTTACATFLFGWLVDRTNRVRMLSWTVAGWGAVVALSAFAGSYDFLLGTRIALGCVAASAAPAVASLIGDYFPPDERGAVYSSVLAGEVIGSGAGFLLAGELATWTWRAGFVALAVPAVLLARAVRRLDEPERGGAARIDRQAHRPDSQQAVAARVIRHSGAMPRPELVLRTDPGRRSLWWVSLYVLRIPTNRVLIVASALGYFYFTGLRTFAVEYFSDWLGVSHPAAIALIIIVGSGALLGVAVSGRIADRLLARGQADARIAVAVVAYCVATGLFVASLLTRAMGLELLLLALAAGGLGAINPPLDAARLDIMYPALWGRAESVRTCLRTAAEAVAPLTFGYVTEHVFGGGAGALHATLFLMVGALAAGGIVAFFARKSYPRDVATVQASLDAISR